jgi:toxin ParE1/3/4
VRLAWTKAAIRDLVHIRRSIAHDNPEAARVVAGRILHAVNSLPRHPEIGRIGRLAGTRELVVTGTPYLVPYRLRARTIELLRVLHGRQKWSKTRRTGYPGHPADAQEDARG